MTQQTDTRIDTKLIEQENADTERFQGGYWTGLLVGRHDPGVRAIYVRYDEATKRPVFRMFSYDELIATAWLLDHGMYHRAAAALVHKEFVIAEPYRDPIHLPEEMTDFFVVKLPDDSEWLIAHGPLPAAHELEFVEDYAGYCIVDGKRINLAKEPRPTFIGVGERINMVAASIQ